MDQGRDGLPSVVTLGPYSGEHGIATSGRGKSIHDVGQASRIMMLTRPHRFAKRGRAKAHRRRQCQTLEDIDDWPRPSMGASVVMVEKRALLGYNRNEYFRLMGVIGCLLFQNSTGLRYRCSGMNICRHIFMGIRREIGYCRYIEWGCH